MEKNKHKGEKQMELDIKSPEINTLTTEAEGLGEKVCEFGDNLSNRL